MADPGFSPAAAEAEPRRGTMPLDAGETIVDERRGVLLGWQPQTILIWWIPGLVFIALAWVEFRSWVVVAGLTAFCLALFLFYSRDREVRPRSGRKHYVLTDRRLLVGDGHDRWRSVALNEVVGTRMESGAADIAVMRLSAAATIVLEMREPGPKGEPRLLRIGPMRNPVTFRDAIDGRLRSTALQSAE